MKKLFYLLIGILLIIPITAKADVSGPAVFSYTVTVNNPNGIDEYDRVEDDSKYVYSKTGRKVPFGTTFATRDDLYGDGELTFVGDGYKYVKVSELTAIEKEFKLDKKYLSDEYEMYALKDTEIKSGPGKGYQTVGKINAGDTVKTRDMLLLEKKYFESEDSKTHQIEYNEKEFDTYFDDWNPWHYVEYNDIVGYITTMDKTIIDAGEDKRNIVFLQDLDVYDINTNEIVHTFKALDKITANIHSLEWTGFYYIEYEDIKGYINYSDYMTPTVLFDDNPLGPLEVIIIGDTDIYSSSDYKIDNDEGSSVIDKSKITGTIPSLTKIKLDYYKNDIGWIDGYYEDGNIKGYLGIGNFDVICSTDFNDNFIKWINDGESFAAPKTDNFIIDSFRTSKKINIYEKPFKDSKIIGTIPANTDFKTEYDTCTGLVYYNDGWIIDNNDNGYGYITEGSTKFPIELNIYDTLEKDRKIVGKIPANKEFEPKYINSYDINNNDSVVAYYYDDGEVKGWVEVISNNGSYSQEKIDDKNDDIVIVKKDKKDYTLYICIGIGIIISLTSIITIILINKKKKTLV